MAGAATRSATANSHTSLSLPSHTALTLLSTPPSPSAVGEGLAPPGVNSGTILPESLRSFNAPESNAPIGMRN